MELNLRNELRNWVKRGKPTDGFHLRYSDRVFVVERLSAELFPIPLPPKPPKGRKKSKK